MQTQNNVDITKKGTYSVVFTATDLKGNKSEKRRIVHVTDTVPPTITVNYVGDTILHEVNTNFMVPTATASDNSGEPVEVKVNSNVDITTLGKYSITYDAVDASGNTADTISLTVEVQDTTGPEIVVLGSLEIDHEINTPYIDAGAAVQDNLDVTYKIYSEGVVDVTQSGVYTITYSAKDTENNEAESKTRTVTVVDTLPPTFAIKGDSELYHEVGTVYVDAGVKLVVDNSNKQVALETLYYDESNNLINDTSELGLSLSTFKVEYTASDAVDLFGNKRTTTKTE